MEDVVIESMRASDLREAAVVVGRAFLPVFPLHKSRPKEGSWRRNDA